MKPREWLRSIGPAIIVAAVVLGPGSILTSSKVGASFGYPALAVLALSVVLMIGMVALAGRLGLAYERSLCDELAARLGRWAAVAVGGILFLVVALFQSSNNIAVVAGLEPLFDGAFDSFPLRAAVLVGMNLFVIVCLFALRHLYGAVERLMKVLIMVLVVAFVVNFLVALFTPRDFVPVAGGGPRDLVPLLGMIGTTFSVAGAFYQAYLVREKGWRLRDAGRNMADSAVSITVLGVVTAVILATSVLAFHGRPGVDLASVGDVANQLVPLFGSTARVVFCIGILAGACSSFLVNAMIGGAIFSDSLGLGSRMDGKGPRHFTALALLIGLAVGLARLAEAQGTVQLITLAQALTVLGLPALALALVYLGTRPELTGNRKVPRWILVLAMAGLAVACLVAVRMAGIVWEKLAG
ncbi:MAG: hypothetical protein HKO57_13025 [Akkermansiaceae bacterium]|nr:hypothetical protein [Akkermansiaceae bacterium]